MDLDRIQGNVVPGFNKDHQAFVLVRFQNAERGRAWLSAVQPDLASAAEVQRFREVFRSVRARAPRPVEPDAGALRYLSATWVNLALSGSGIRLIAGAQDAARFPTTFRLNHLPGARPTASEEHALLIVAADRSEDLESELQEQRERLSTVGVEEVQTFRGDTLPGDARGREHFGFKDTISQPRIAGTDWGTGPSVAPGEFVLGYPDQISHASGTSLPAWARNGSFLAFVQLQQHVATFWAAMKQQAQQYRVAPGELAAWIVGRSEDGTEVPQPPARVSHIGRAYSRWLPASEASRHRILRRGIPYGEPWTEGQPDAPPERGLFFLAYQADIERQFERIWTQWLNAPGFPTPAAGSDAFVGQTSQPVAGRPVDWRDTARHSAVAWRPRQYGGGQVKLSLPVFVTPQYGGYFFAPALDAVARLAATGQGRTARSHYTG